MPTYVYKIWLISETCQKMHSHYFEIADGSPGITDNIIADNISMAELDQEFNDEESLSC